MENENLGQQQSDGVPEQVIPEQAQTVEAPISEPVVEPVPAAVAPVAVKSKKGLIIGIIIAAVVLIGGGVILATTLGKDDEGKKDDETSKNVAEYSDEELTKRGQAVYEAFEEMGEYVESKYDTSSSHYDFTGDEEWAKIVDKFRHAIVSLGEMVEASDNSSLKEQWSEFRTAYDPRAGEISNNLDEGLDSGWIKDLSEISMVVSSGSAGGSGVDTDLKDDVSIVASAVTSYQSNNRGVLPNSPATFLRPFDGAGFGSYLGDLSENINRVEFSTGVPSSMSDGASASSDTIWVYTGATCNESGTGVVSGTARQAAVTVYLSTGELYCIEN